MELRNFYYLILTVFVFASALTFTSCSDDDDYDEDDNILIADTSSDDETTSSDATYVNGYAAFDLGLSVKWADRNIGASSSSAFGDYFAWGETETKDVYSDCVTSNVKMDDIAGDAEYDAATANWGGSWRMPTLIECHELLYNCTWTWTTENEVNGYLVTGSNGNSIFLPAAGNRYWKYLYNAGSYGYYWTSSPYGSNTYASYYLGFNSSGYYYITTSYRDMAFTVRPVTE